MKTSQSRCIGRIFARSLDIMRCQQLRDRFAQMFGVIMARHVIKLEPMASATHEELVELLAPTIQRYFTG